MSISRNRILSFFALLGAAVVSAAVAWAQMPPENQPDTTIDAGIRAATIHTLIDDLERVYVFPDMAGELAKMLKEREARGEYNNVTSAKEFAKLLNDHMHAVAHDAHLRVFYSAQGFPPVPPAPTPSFPPGMLRMLANSNYGFLDAKILDGNIGYLKETGFPGADLSANTTVAAMAFLSDTDALILDLRHNNGGAPTSVDMLVSYFFPPGSTVHINDLATRIPGTRDYELHQWWTLPYLPGKRYLDKEVYVLVGPDTKSAGEEFTNDLKTQKRATIVGAPTWGGANPGSGNRLSEHFIALIPDAHVINPITKSNWEGVGVQPDIAVAPADAFKTAYKLALQHLIEKTTDERELMGLKQVLANVDAAPAMP